MNDAAGALTDRAQVEAIIARYRPSIIAAMGQALDRPGVGHVELMTTHLGWDADDGGPGRASGGKMVRPVLCLLVCEAVGGDIERALPAAAAIELLHNFTLIHDDIEDASDTRHGRPTLWRRAGIPLAINAGDGMFVLAQRTLLRLWDAGVPAPDVLRAAAVLDEACIALCEGQHLDIGFEKKSRVTLLEYEAMIAGKTAALLGASAEIGALAGGAPHATAHTLGEAGRLLGLAFQVQDDVLGIWGDSSLTGKPVGDDIRARKKSYPAVYALDHLTGEARDRFSAMYDPRSATPPDVPGALSLLEDCGARDAATAAARGYMAQALGVLRSLPLEEGPRADIAALAASFVQRSA
ncbi:MAG: polyprenyl synthetase family protein [Chloroflexi bacterium]|nr:polyprenyl synthetase family protein [Chloroflexota bacterium]